MKHLTRCRCLARYSVLSRTLEPVVRRRLLRRVWRGLHDSGAVKCDLNERRGRSLGGNG